MDRIYSWQVSFYDVTRKYYLLGRDELITQLKPEDGSDVLEIGCGTGRNLISALKIWPRAHFYGIDVSSVMLAEAAQSIVRHKFADHIRIAYADALTFDSVQTFKKNHFQRIYFSYTLSMIPNWRLALDRALDILAPNGRLLIADFGNQHGLPVWFRSLLFWWLSLFHVRPRDDFELFMRRMAQDKGLSLEFQPLYYGYAFIAVFTKPNSATLLDHTAK
ncbi:MAG: class I SAM-dependent methyltransferase [Methylocystaceae bacterium]|nr:class I SAM-dependent methyltransferase [Methylocystaceae bacterium]